MKLTITKLDYNLELLDGEKNILCPRANMITLVEYSKSLISIWNVNYFYNTDLN